VSDLRQRLHARALAGVQTSSRLAVDDLAAFVTDEAPLLSPGEASAVLATLWSDVHGLGPLDPVLADPEVTDVLVHGAGEVWVERRGQLERLALSLDASTVGALIERIVGPLGLRVDRSSPIIDARLSDGSRVHVVVPPLAVDGPCLTIRRFGVQRLHLEAFAPPAVVRLLAGAVAARANIVVSGGTGAGKTTLLNALAAFIDRGERIVTIEDAAELRLEQGHVVRLEARPANAEGAGRVAIRDLVRAALRMRPDRIVVGETRGGEALDMLQAMNTGHEGSLSTCHANAPDDALRRLETMVMLAESGLPLDAVREQLVAAVDLIVQVARRPDGTRAVLEVAEVVAEAGAGHRGRTRRLADAEGVVARPVRPRLANP